MTRQRSHDGTGTDTEGESVLQDLDPNFLAALPDEIRQEVIEQNRRERLRRTGGIDLSLHQKSRARKQAKGQQQEAVERLFKLSPRPAKPTFTKEKLSDTHSLRQAVKDWVREFWDSEPFAEDVQALSGYLCAVITDEGDMAKAVKIVKWMGYVMDTLAEGTWQGDEHQSRWDVVLTGIKEDVQAAVRQRGLGRITF